MGLLARRRSFQCDRSGRRQTVANNKKLSCHRQAARRFMWLNISLRHSKSRSFETAPLSTACVKSLPFQRVYTKTAPKILISKNIVQNGPFRCPKRPIIQPKRPIAKSKTAHSYIQNGPLSLSAFSNIQSDLEILYVEASYTRVRGLDDSETVKCSATHYGVTCSKFKSVNGRKYCM